MNTSSYGQCCQSKFARAKETAALLFAGKECYLDANDENTKTITQHKNR